METNWKDYKFHCSALPTLMTDGRSKEALLSETTKSALLEIWIAERFGREKIIQTKQMEKGTAVESDSLELVSQVTKQKLFKNIKTLENDHLIGTPDVVKSVIDIKSSWDIYTYFAVDEKEALKRYKWQLKGYMILTGQNKSQLVFALVNTPEHLIYEELRRLSFKLGITDEEAEEKYRKNYEFDDIDPKIRVKSYDIILEDGDKEELEKRVTLWREYLAELDKELL